MRMREYRAAGGVVVDDAGQVLLIERWITRNYVTRHEVRLPKGHVEPGETDLEAALRETCEETGYCGLHVLADLGDTITEWSNDFEQVRRTEHYYLLALTDPVRGEPHFTSPDSEEALFRPLWVADFDEAEARLTFPSERMFAGRARAIAWALAPNEPGNSPAPDA